jgi:hypothetical protein
MSGKPKTGNVRLKCDMRKGFCKEIGSVHDTGSVIDKEEFGFNMRTNEMIANVDVFGLAVIGIVD